MARLRLQQQRGACRVQNLLVVQEVDTQEMKDNERGKEEEE